MSEVLNFLKAFYFSAFSDFQGTTTPCYVNVLSWDKVNMPKSPLEPIPLYGGMRISPPRSEKQNVFVFAVIANPLILYHRGKNAEDPEVRFGLIC